MSRYRSQNKNIWRSNKPETNQQPITEIVYRREIKKKAPKFNASEIKPPKQVPPSLSLQKGPSEAFENNLFTNKSKIGKNEALKIEIKCVDECCQNDDILSVLSFGGYSIKSKAGRPNKILHNHRKINKETIYNYVEDEIPFLNLIEYNQYEQIQQAVNKSNPKTKKDWRKSAFAPLFYSKTENANHLEKQTFHYEKRQKEIIQTHQKNLKAQIQNQKAKKTKNYSTYLSQRQLKQIKNYESVGDNRLTNKSPSNNGKNQPNSAFEKGKIKTRQQQRKLNNDDFQISKPPQPGNKQCYPCKIRFQNYKEHVESNEHKLNVQKALGSSLFVQEMDKIKEMKKRQSESKECKMLEDFSNYLFKIVESNDQYILKKHQQLKHNMRKIHDELQRWLRT